MFYKDISSFFIFVSSSHELKTNPKNALPDAHSAFMHNATVQCMKRIFALCA